MDSRRGGANAFLWLLVLIPAVSASSGRRVGNGIGSMEVAPRWLQEKHGHSGLYFPLKHKKHLHLEHAEEQEDGRGLQASTGDSDVSWGLIGSGGLTQLEYGVYFTSIVVGANKQPFNVIIDTGSTLTWVKCECLAPCVNASQGNPNPSNPPLKYSNTTRFETCGSPNSYCSELSNDYQTQGCSTSSDPCLFTIQYGDGSQVEGPVIVDVLTLVTTAGDEVQTYVPIGCAQSMSDSFAVGPYASDGLMGLGRAGYSLVEVLNQTSKHVVAESFSMCLESDSNAGHLILGRTALEESGYLIPLSISDSLNSIDQ